MESSGLSNEDARDRDHWRLKVKGKLPNPGLSEKWPLKWQLCVLLYNCYFRVTPGLPVLGVYLGNSVSRTIYRSSALPDTEPTLSKH